MKQREQAISRYQLASPHATSIPHELIPLLPANWSAEIPLARITTCGPNVSIAVLRQIHPGTETDGHPTLVYGPPDAALLEEKGASTALLLLAVLASQPHCSATKDWLSETLGHGNHDDDEDDLDGNPGLKRVDNVATQLRHLLFPPVLRDLPTANQLRRQLVISYRATRESGSGYRLAGLPLLWIDVEAIGEHLKQARALDRFGHDGLPAWQAAYEVAGRGIFLEREPYSDWASWRRQQVETQLWQCVQALWRPLANQGEAGETEAVRILQSYWQSHITNEDVFRPLIELLGKRECYGQAEEYYAHLCLALEEEGKQPDHRTQETMMFLRALQIQREPSQHQAILTTDKTEQTSSGQSLSPDRMQQAIAFPLQVDWGIWFGSKLAQLITIVDHWQEQAIFCDQLQTILDQEIIGFHKMQPEINDSSYVLSRRQALATIAMLPSAIWTSVQQEINSTSVTEKFLKRCAASITTLWHLLKGNELLLIEQVLSTYVLTLVTLAQQPSLYQKTAARLTSQAYRLHGIVALHRNNLKAREKYCQQALYYSELAQNTSLIVSAHISLASTCYYRGDPVKAAHIYQKALMQDDAIPLLQRSRIHAELAVVYAQQKQVQEALDALGLAQDLYPEHPENDPSFLYAEFSPASMILEEGLTYLALAQRFPEHDYKYNAQKVFASIEKLQLLEDGVPERVFFEITNQRAATALILRDLDQVSIYLEFGMEGAQRLQSKQRRQEAVDIYEQALTLWPNETRLKRLRDIVRS